MSCNMMVISARCRLLTAIGLVAIGLAFWPAVIASAAGEPDEPAFQAMVEEDWTAQERRRGREPSDPEAIHAAVQAAENLVQDLRTIPGCPDLSDQEAALRGLRQATTDLTSTDEAARLSLY